MSKGTKRSRAASDSSAGPPAAKRSRGACGLLVSVVGSESDAADILPPSSSRSPPLLGDARRAGIYAHAAAPGLCALPAGCRQSNDGAMTAAPAPPSPPPPPPTLPHTHSRPLGQHARHRHVVVDRGHEYCHVVGEQRRPTARSPAALARRAAAAGPAVRVAGCCTLRVWCVPRPPSLALLRARKAMANVH